MKIKITFTEEVLGTSSSNPDIHREFIASKAPDATTIKQEVEAIGVDASIEKSTTIFPKRDGKPFFWDYQIKGFFKDACASLARVPGTKSNAQKAYRKVIDGTIFVFPREIPVTLAGSMGHCQRPLRAETAQGPRVALANSETLPAGSSMEVEIRLLDERNEKMVAEWLDYGALRGLGQWRNSGKGRFSWEEIK